VTGEKMQEPKHFSSRSINFMSVLGSFLYVGFLIDQVLDSTSEGGRRGYFSGACQALESAAAIYGNIYE
jgi:hypothetical protein